MIKVGIFESEKGWGRNLLNYKLFNSIEDADDFILKFNSKNDLKQTPEYYIFAKHMGPETDDEKCERIANEIDPDRTFLQECEEVVQARFGDVNALKSEVKE